MTTALRLLAAAALLVLVVGWTFLLLAPLSGLDADLATQTSAPGGAD